MARWAVMKSYGMDQELVILIKAMGFRHKNSFARRRMYRWYRKWTATVCSSVLCPYWTRL